LDYDGEEDTARDCLDINYIDFYDGNSLSQNVGGWKAKIINGHGDDGNGVWDAYWLTNDFFGDNKFGDSDENSNAEGKNWSQFNYSEDKNENNVDEKNRVKHFRNWRILSTEVSSTCVPVDGESDDWKFQKVGYVTCDEPVLFELVRDFDTNTDQLSKNWEDIMVSEIAWPRREYELNLNYLQLITSGFNGDDEAKPILDYRNAADGPVYLVSDAFVPQQKIKGDLKQEISDT